MDKETLIELLTNIEEDGIMSLHAKGYTWVKSHYLPYLELADTLIPDEGELLADCWYLMGDICDFNVAPLKAIEYYQKAIECDEEIDGAYREISSMLEQVGRYAEALDYINVAIEMTIENNKDLAEELMEERAAIQDSINYSTEAYLTEDNQAWKLNELLANDDFDTVIKQIEAEASPESYVLQALAKAYGAKEDEANYLKTWDRIAADNNPFSLDYGDWYYMPTSIYEGTTIWEMFKKMNNRIEESEFIQFDSLNEHYGPQMSQAELIHLVCDYQIYTVTSNVEGIKNLAKQYPLWEEVQG